MRGLYVHIPFCSAKCHYCDFTTTLYGSGERVELFLNAIRTEAQQWAPVFSQKRFDTLYFGGGTPSVLSKTELSRLFDILRRSFSFKKDVEITFEVNPGDVDREKAVRLASLGANRISLGAQTFRDRSLGELHRVHDSEAIRRTFRNLRREGFKNISLDLMLSLPGETVKDVERSIEETLLLDPEHVSLYELVIEEKTAFGRLMKKGALDLPSEEVQLEMLLLARTHLKKAGYKQYELLNYAKPGFESRHNILYWKGEDTLGLGPGAFSYLAGRRFCVSRQVNCYFKKIESKDPIYDEDEKLNRAQKESEGFILALRLAEGAEKKLFGPTIERKRDVLADLIEKGLLAETRNTISLTEKGTLFAETVFSGLL